MSTTSTVPSPLPGARTTPVGFQVTVDCADPHAQASFWAAALGYEIERLQRLGAAALQSYDEPKGRWTTMADPEGNEFCVQ